MSYPKNYPVTYTAIGSAQGSPSNTFSYLWEFDDGGTGTSATISHTWSSDGNHVAIVTATDDITGASANTSKSIRISSVWTQEAFPIPSYTENFYGPPCIQLVDGSILIVGTRTDNNATIGNTSYVYNPLTHVLTQVGSLPASRTYTSGCSALRLSDGRVFITGGYVNGSNYGVETKRSFIYSPTTQSWSEVASSSYGIEYGSIYTSTLMTDGRVFASSSLMKNEVYNPTTNTWITLPAQPINTSGNGPSVCLMSDGRVFRGPGVNDGNVNCVAYNPSTNSWDILAPCPASQARIISMNDGRLIGIDLVTPTPGVYLYTPSTDSWTTEIGPTISTPADYPTLYAIDDKVIYTRRSTNIATYNGSSWDFYPSLNYTHSGTTVVSGGGVLCSIGDKSGSTIIEYL